ncbi:3'-5' exonuclease [Altericista sp. CCNU0014]|uniref:3'-5' exonuclease n=1 Tax=Altericista sp. CCNU0014 TaxID=3082949 RepID=UPI00384DE36C
MKTFVAIDFETANRSRESACSIGIIRVEDFQIVQKAHYLIRPVEPEFEFTSIHGICWDDVAQELTFGELWPSIERLLRGAEAIAAHNASFDRGVLYACCDAYGIERPLHPFLCTVQLARKTWKIHPTKLPNVCDYLDIPLVHHQALSDAEACARIAIAAIAPAR